MSKSELKRKKAEKSKVGMGRRVTSLESLDGILELGVKDVIARHPMKTIGAGLATAGLAIGTYQMKKHDKRMKTDPKYARRYKAIKARQMREGIAEDRKIANLKPGESGYDESHVRKAKQRLGRRVTSLSALGEILEFESEASKAERYVNYHRRKMLRTYAKDRGRNQAKKAGFGAALGGIAGGILGGRRGFRKGLKGAATGAAIGGVAGLGSPTRGSKKNKMIEDVKRRALKEHTVRAYGQQAQRKGHSFYINPKYNKKTYA
jgi:outer membrane lipoprotein SlyB